MNMLTSAQIERQDLVDNAIFDLICEVNPYHIEIDWNMEIIGEIRDVIQNIFVEQIGVGDEMTFYPYVDGN